MVVASVLDSLRLTVSRRFTRRDLHICRGFKLISGERLVERAAGGVRVVSGREIHHPRDRRSQVEIAARILVDEVAAEIRTGCRAEVVQLARARRRMHPKAGGKSAPSAGVGVHQAFDRHDQWV